MYPYEFNYIIPAMKHLIFFCTILLVLGLLTSCSTARLTSSWTNETYTPQQYNKVLVFAVASKTSNRAAVEGAMTTELKKHGIQAVSSLSLFPESQNANGSNPPMISKEELARKLKDNNVDGLLVLSLLDKKEEEIYVEGHTTTHTESIPQQAYVEPVYNYHYDGYNDRYDPYYNNYYVYYQTVQTTVTEPGYYENQTTLYLESNFYRVDDAALVWSGQTEVVDPSGVTAGAMDWAAAVTKAMILYKVILP